MEKNDDGLLPSSFEVKFTISDDVLNINDDFINRDKIVEAAKAAARAELIRQAIEATSEGAFDVGD